MLFTICIEGGKMSGESNAVIFRGHLSENRSKIENFQHRINGQHWRNGRKFLWESNALISIASPRVRRGHHWSKVGNQGIRTRTAEL